MISIKDSNVHIATSNHNDNFIDDIRNYITNLSKPFDNESIKAIEKYKKYIPNEDITELVLDYQYELSINHTQFRLSITSINNERIFVHYGDNKIKFTQYQIKNKCNIYYEIGSTNIFIIYNIDTNKYNIHVVKTNIDIHKIKNIPLNNIELTYDINYDIVIKNINCEPLLSFIDCLNDDYINITNKNTKIITNKENICYSQITFKCNDNIMLTRKQIFKQDMLIYDGIYQKIEFVIFSNMIDNYRSIYVDDFFLNNDDFFQKVANIIFIISEEIIDKLNRCDVLNEEYGIYMYNDELDELDKLYCQIETKLSDDQSNTSKSPLEIIDIISKTVKNFKMYLLSTKFILS